MKSMLVIGVGRFGRHLSRKLSELGNEIMVVDKEKSRVELLAPIVTSAHVADCRDEAVLKTFGVSNFDVCFVCVSNDFQSSLEITSMLYELGAKFIVAKADREKQAKFLEKIGANVVIHAEMDMAHRAAVRYSASNAFEYIELSSDYAISEIMVPANWVRKSILSLNIRSKFNVNIIAQRFGSEGNTHFIPILNAEHVFAEGEHLLLAGDVKNIIKMSSRS